MDNKNHWTDVSSKKFRLDIAHGFIDRVDERLDELDMTCSDFACTLGVDKSRVSRVFNNPGNLTLDTIVKWCRALQMKPAVVIYDDEAVSERAAPIHPDVFLKCWEDAKMPVDMWGFEETLGFGEFNVPYSRDEVSKDGHDVTHAA